LILLFIPFFLFAGVIENNISKIYKETYPTIKINNIYIKTYTPYNKIISIDTSTINTKKASGVIKINHSIFATYKIDANLKVLKSTSTIHKNDKIDYTNSKLTSIKFKNFYSYPITKYDYQIAAKMYIPKGQIIYEYMTQKPFLVKRGEHIKVISKSGNIEIILDATAMQNGRKNDIIKVKIKKKIYHIQIISQGMGKL